MAHNDDDEFDFDWLNIYRYFIVLLLRNLRVESDSDLNVPLSLVPNGFCLSGEFPSFKTDQDGLWVSHANRSCS